MENIKKEETNYTNNSLRINNLKIKEDLSNLEVIDIALKKYFINPNDIEKDKTVISKKSIDARDKANVMYIYSVDVCFKVVRKSFYFNKFKVHGKDIHSNQNKFIRDISEIKEKELPVIKTCDIKNFDNPPVIVGAGPSGLFAALTFVENGIAPIVIEQGKTASERKKDIDNFLTNSVLNPLSNVQFGEGGAGTFSDGKLTTRN